MSAIYDRLYNQDEPHGEGSDGQASRAEPERQCADEARDLPGSPPLRRSPRPIGGASLVSRIKSLFS